MTSGAIFVDTSDTISGVIFVLFSDNGDKKFTYKDECKIEEALKIAVKAGNDLKKQFEMAK